MIDAFGLALRIPFVAALITASCSLPCRSQAPDSSALTAISGPTLGIKAEPILPDRGSARGNGEFSVSEAPQPADPTAADEPTEVPWAAKVHQQPFSRVGIGADVSPLGIGIKSAVVLTQYFDARGNVNFFNYDTGIFELEGFRVDAKLHMASMGAMVDYYPLNSIWRLSAGMMLFNGNQLSATSQIVPGTKFSLNGQNFYSANANPVTGATPLTGTGLLGLHRNQPAFMASGGFGKFIPRSRRHWSFPSEFGVVLTGAPTVDVNFAGWVCTDAQQTRCSNLGSAGNPVSVQFNNALQTQLTKWRRSLSAVTVYPIFSYSVVYSFNVR